MQHLHQRDWLSQRLDVRAQLLEAATSIRDHGYIQVQVGLACYDQYLGEIDLDTAALVLAGDSGPLATGRLNPVNLRIHPP